MDASKSDKKNTSMPSMTIRLTPDTRFMALETGFCFVPLGDMLCISAELRCLHRPRAITNIHKTNTIFTLKVIRYAGGVDGDAILSKSSMTPVMIRTPIQVSTILRNLLTAAGSK